MSRREARRIRNPDDILELPSGFYLCKSSSRERRLFSRRDTRAAIHPRGFPPSSPVFLVAIGKAHSSSSHPRHFFRIPRQRPAHVARLSDLEVREIYSERVRGGVAAGDGGSRKRVGNEARGEGRREVREIHRANGGF